MKIITNGLRFDEVIYPINLATSVMERGEWFKSRF